MNYEEWIAKQERDKDYDFEPETWINEDGEKEVLEPSFEDFVCGACGYTAEADVISGRKRNGDKVFSFPHYFGYEVCRCNRCLGKY